MGQSKPKGISQDDYKKAQESLHNEKFQFDANQRFQNLQFQMNALKKNIEDILSAQGSDKRCVDTQLEQIMEANMSSLKEFRYTLNDFKNDMQGLDNAIKANGSMIDSCIERNTFNEKLSHLHECIKRLHGEKDAMRKEFNGLIECLKVDFDQKLQDAKNEILARPSEVPALKHLMDQKLELVELNGQNAVLRSSNNERQILLVERKIDNLYQLVKALDIKTKE
jgi:ElaB/YqjD/DUF883 family membrane-anchored ribosome-binding protein